MPRQPARARVITVAPEGPADPWMQTVDPWSGNLGRGPTRVPEAQKRSHRKSSTSRAEAEAQTRDLKSDLKSAAGRLRESEAQLAEAEALLVLKHLAATDPPQRKFDHETS